MNDRSLSHLLAELDLELGRETNNWPLASAVLERVERRAPGAVQRSAAGIELRGLGCVNAKDHS